jgi:hypothetical protein
MNWHNVRWLIQDLIFPSDETLSEEQIREHLTRRSTEAEELLAGDQVLTGCVDECGKLLEAEDSRRQSVDGRLATIVGLASIAGTILFGGIWAGATGALHSDNRAIIGALAGGGFYLALQIGRAVLAAVEGLSRRNYGALEPSDVLQHQGEDQSSFARRRARKCLDLLADHQLRNNEKVTKMAVAHRALQNFMVALMVLSFVGGRFAVTTRARGQDELIEDLRKDQRVLELLRGPQGPQGPKGDPGTPAAPVHKNRLKPERKAGH